MASVPTRIETTIDLGDRTAAMFLRVNRRARKLIVKIDPVSGAVLVTAPSQRAVPDAIAFARSRAGWIREQLDRASGGRAFANGVRFPLRGEPTLLVHTGRRRDPVRLEGATLYAGGDTDHLNRRVIDWLKAESRQVIIERVDAHTRSLGRRRGPISIRDPKTRWGSCARDGAMSFSWRLILAPPEILDYVAAHECAHLVHLDHSPGYWRVLKSLGVDARAARDWFERHGATLHAWGAVSP